MKTTTRSAKEGRVKDMPKAEAGREEGFSLVELLVVLVITFFISGAIYGLLASGSSAFRKEPEVADRQQNIRAAMDIISKDIANAGAGLPAFVQVFTINDPAGTPLNGGGPAGSMGNPAALRTAGDTANSDLLEMIAGDERCPILNVCSTVAAGTANTFLTREGAPQCLADARLGGGLVILTDNINMTVQPFTTAPAGGTCPGVLTTSYSGAVPLGAAVQVGTSPAAPALTTPMFLVTGRVVRYMIANNTDPLDTSPTLWRSVTGRYAQAGGVVSPAPGAAGSAWQPVARGIEDMQVEYMSSGGTWANSPPAAVPCTAPAGAPAGPCTDVNSYNALVRQVRVTLSARAVGQPNAPIQGATRAAGTGPDALRGQLVSVTQPRAAQVALEIGDQVR